jgi:hypothetical protein
MHLKIALGSAMGLALGSLVAAHPGYFDLEARQRAGGHHHEEFSKLLDHIGILNSGLNKMQQTAVSPEDWTHATWQEGTMPFSCYKFARDTGVDPYDIRVSNLTMSDCPGGKWYICIDTHSQWTNEFVNRIA